MGPKTANERDLDERGQLIEYTLFTFPDTINRQKKTL